MTDWNTDIIEEFRANDGKVGGMFEGADLLILHTIGARTGQDRVNPVMYQVSHGNYAIFASKAGSADHPDWYHNIKANAEVSIEVGSTKVNATARVLDDEEREPIWNAQKAAYPQFAEYEQTAEGRQIPVIVLSPKS